MPDKPKTARRLHKIVIAVSVEEHERCKTAATGMGLTIAGFVRQAALTAVREQK